MAFFLHWYENVLSLLCVDRIYLCYQQNLEGLDMDTEKKSLVSREIRSFRDTYRVSWLLLILALRTLLVWFLCWVSQCLFYEYITACIIGHKVQLELQGCCTQQELWEQQIDQINLNKSKFHCLYLSVICPSWRNWNIWFLFCSDVMIIVLVVFQSFVLLSRKSVKIFTPVNMLFYVT